MAITNATLATKINDLIDFWDSFRQEYENWLGGVVGGGPSSDGKYPLTDYVGTVQTVASPAQLQDDVDNTVTGAAGHKTAAQAAQAAAETAQTAAELAETNAETAETGSVTAKVASEAAQSAAESARTTAIAQAAAAAADAVLTAADAVATAADAVATAADAVSTDADATAAAASAAAAAASAASIGDLDSLTDVVITTPATKHVPVYDGANFVNRVLVEADISDFGSYLTGITGQSIKNLSDVLSSMAPTDGQALIYDTTNGWQAETISTSEVNDLSAAVTWANVPVANIPNLDTAKITTGVFPDSRIASKYFRHITGGYNNADVSVAATAPSSPAQGDIWFDTAATIPLDYEQLDDVTITAIASGEIAKWNGTAWINNTLAEAGIAAAAHTHDSITDTNLLDKSAAETISGVYTFSAAANFTAAPTKSALGIPYYITATYTGGKITVASTAPSSPAKGDLWFDTT